MKEFATPEALKLILRSLDNRDNPVERDLEDYSPPDESEQVFCTTREREEFEEEKQIALTEDVISDQRDYDDLVRFLVENYELKEI